MTLNWTIFLFMALAMFLLVMIFLFVKLNNRNNEYYNVIHGELMNLVPLKIDLKNEMITFSDKLEVLNKKKRVSIFVFKSMINRKAKVELEIFFQNLLVNKVPFNPVDYLIYFQLHSKVIIYDLTLNYYDQENQILYGQMQSNTRYNRFIISERIDVSSAQLTVPKIDFLATILNFFQNEKKQVKENNFYEYMMLIKIKNYNNLESILTINNIESIELLLTYCVKNLLGNANTLICKYYDGEFLVYSKHKKFNLIKFQKKLNNYIKNNLVEKSSYLQIQTQIISVYSLIKKESNLLVLYNKIIDVNLLNANFDHNLKEIKLRTNENHIKTNNHFELIHSQEIKKLLTIKISPVYKTDNAKEPDCYYARLGVIDNAYYGNYLNLIRNIQDAGIWWKVYEPLFLQILHDFAQLKIKNKNLIIPFLLMELENKTVLTQILNIISKRQSLFEEANLIFDFQDNCLIKISNWIKYENIINILRKHNVKIAFSHELINISNFKLISHFNPDLVILTANLLQNVTFRFSKFVKVIICLNYLNILEVKKVMALGVSSVPEIIVLKSLKIKYLSGSIFESENVDRIIDSLNYSSYLSWKKSQNKKGNK
ncbi:MAG: hypothetical protein ACRC8P_01160 [Spiroplasma sp.]